MIDGFFGLRHDSVVSSDHQHDDVGNFRAARTHAGEGFVTGRVDENHTAVIDHDFVRADVLGDSSGFAACDIGLANSVQQTGFSVIHVAHHGDDWLTRLEAFLGFFLGNFKNHFLFKRNDADYAAERFGEGGSGGHVKSLVDAGEDTAIEQIFEQFFGAHVEFFGELANGDAFGDGDFARGAGLRWRNDGSGRAAVAHTWALTSGMELALAFLFALVGNRSLTVRRVARVTRLAGLGLRRKFFRERRRKHAWTTGSARAGARASGHGTAALFKRASRRAAWTSGRTRHECSSRRGLLRAHGLARAGTSRGTLGSLTKGTRSSMCGAGKRAAVA